MRGGIVRVIGSHFERLAADEGGAIYVRGADAACAVCDAPSTVARLTVHNSSFRGCVAARGGAVAIRDSRPSFAATTFEGCRADVAGGALHASEVGSFGLTDCSFVGNRVGSRTQLAAHFPLGHGAAVDYEPSGAAPTLKPISTQPAPLCAHMLAPTLLYFPPRQTGRFWMLLHEREGSHPRAKLVLDGMQSGALAQRFYKGCIY